MNQSNNCNRGYYEEPVDWAEEQAARFSRNQTPTSRYPIQTAPITGSSLYQKRRPNMMSQVTQMTNYDDMISSSQVREIIVHGVAKARYDRPVVTHAYLNSPTCEYNGFTPKHLKSRKWTI